MIEYTLKEWFGRIEEACGLGKITEDEARKLAEISRMIMNYITRKMKHETAERMVSTVGGQVLKLNEDVWFEDGRKAGREEGIKEGKEEGIKEGKEQGIKEGESNMKDAAIRIFIQDKQEDGITDNIIKEKLMRFLT